jgi:hypothetical protein
MEQDAYQEFRAAPRLALNELAVRQIYYDLMLLLER